MFIFRVILSILSPSDPVCASIFVAFTTHFEQVAVVGIRVRSLVTFCKVGLAGNQQGKVVFRP